MWSVPIAVALALAASSCSGGADPSGIDAPVLAFGEIQDGPITPIPTDAGAIALEIGTTIDVACSVVYGPDGSFGSIATDSDMSGGAHRVHRPLLVDLAPGVTYSYRLQGVDAEGNLYASETFTIVGPEPPPTNDTPAPGPIISDDATIASVSSEFSQAFAAANAIDGDRSSEWSSAGDGDDAWIEIDLGAPAAITGVGFWTRSMSDGSAVASRFAVSVDGERVGTFDAEPGETVAAFEAVGQLVRIDVVASSGGNTGAREIVVYGR